MRLTFSLFLSTISLMIANTQTYKLSEFETIQNDEKDAWVSHTIKLHLIKNEVDTIDSYELGTDGDFHKSITMSEVKNLDYMKAKIKVELTSTACCSSIETYYYLITHDDDIVRFNKIWNTHCDGPEPKYDLIFPSDTFGRENSIYLGRIIYDQASDYVNEKIKYIEYITEMYPNHLDQPN